MAIRTIADGGGNWSSTATWVEGQVPTAADDVVATMTSGNLTIDVGAGCRSIDLSNYSSTLTHNAFTLTVGTSTANGTEALVFPTAGWVYTLSDPANSAIAFSSTVASTTLTVDFGGQTTGNVSFSASSTSGHQLVNNGFSNGSTASVTLTQGGLDINDQTCSWGSFNSNNSNTRALTLGAASINLNSTGTVWDITNSSGLTFDAGTSSILVSSSGTSGTMATMNAGSQTYNNVSFAVGGSWQLAALNGSNPTFADLTVTGPATKGAVLSLGTSLTVTTALTLNGSNANTNRLLVNSTAVGTQQTITNNGSGTFSNLDLQDIAGSGSASWNLSAISGGSGDCLGNSGITFTTARGLFWVGNTGNWSSANKWALSSGGSGNQSNPLAQDSPTFDSHSFSGTGQTVTCDMPRMGKNVDFTNVTNSPMLSLSLGLPAIARLYGSLTLVSGMTQGSASSLYFEGRSSNNLTSGGVTFTNNVTVNAPGGTLNLVGNLVATPTNGVRLLAGTLSAGSANVTAPTFLSTGTLTRVVNMGSGTWTMNGTGFPWNTSTTGLTVNAQSSNLVISDTSATSKTVNGGWSFNALVISGDNVTLGGTNTIATLAVNTAGLTNGFKLASFGTTTITNAVTTNGSAGNLAIMVAVTPGSAATLTKASGTISVDYMKLQDVHATGGAGWYAGNHSNNVSNNTGWLFESVPGWTGGWGIPIQ